MIADGFWDCILLHAFYLFCFPHRLFPCILAIKVPPKSVTTSCPLLTDSTFIWTCMFIKINLSWTEFECETDDQRERMIKESYHHYFSLKFSRHLFFLKRMFFLFISLIDFVLTTVFYTGVSCLVWSRTLAKHMQVLMGKAPIHLRLHTGSNSNVTGCSFIAAYLQSFCAFVCWYVWVSVRVSEWERERAILVIYTLRVRYFMNKKKSPFPI